MADDKPRKQQVIRVDIDVPGEGWEAHEYEHCPLRESMAVMCSIRPLPCNYGLTEIDVPHECPLRRSAVTMRYKRIQSTGHDEMHALSEEGE